jgi:hypothetical protein
MEMIIAVVPPGKNKKPTLASGLALVSAIGYLPTPLAGQRAKARNRYQKLLAQKRTMKPEYILNCGCNARGQRREYT